jgi:hypothetical protein
MPSDDSDTVDCTAEDSRRICCCSGGHSVMDVGYDTIHREPGRRVGVGIVLARLCDGRCVGCLAIGFNGQVLA